MRTHSSHVASRLVTALAIAASVAFGERTLSRQEPVRAIEARAVEGCTAGYVIGPEAYPTSRSGKTPTSAEPFRFGPMEKSRSRC